ncbi:MAG: tryptophan-rich sensory protein [Chloroflexi bacterium]|nr:MAG: tryptophan-rich sensory protein [Chloroflexota bacterium]
MDYQAYYSSLTLPFWAPPAFLFGVVWPFLYVLMAISFGYVIYKVTVKKQWRSRLLLPIGINLITNALYTPLFFNLQLPIVAMIDIVIVLATIIWFQIVIWPLKKWVALLLVPYLAWVAFATCLQVAIIVLN